MPSFWERRLGDILDAHPRTNCILKSSQYGFLKITQRWQAEPTNSLEGVLGFLHVNPLPLLEPLAMSGFGRVCLRLKVQC